MHRHLFHIEARCQVDHDDREVEFHDVRDALELAWTEMGNGINRNFGRASCEDLARRLGQYLMRGWPRAWMVSVSEDGEAGAEVSVGPIVRER